MPSPFSLSLSLTRFPVKLDLESVAPFGMSARNFRGQQRSERCATTDNRKKTNDLGSSRKKGENMSFYSLHAFFKKMTYGK